MPLAIDGATPVFYAVTVPVTIYVCDRPCFFLRELRFIWLQIPGQVLFLVLLAIHDEILGIPQPRLPCGVTDRELLTRSPATLNTADRNCVQYRHCD